MRELRSSYNPQAEKPKPVWENPESELFKDWYVAQNSKEPEEQSAEFKALTEEQRMTDEEIARHRIDPFRIRQNEKPQVEE